MTDGELLNIAGDMASLTDAARAAMQGELARRQIDVEVTSPAVVDHRSPQKRTSRVGTTVLEQSEIPPDAVLVDVARFRDLPQAQMAKAALESAGIPSVMTNDNMVRMDWFWSNALGGIRLQVQPENVDDAKRILSEPIPESFEVDGVGEFEQPSCPKCGSLDISFQENAPVAYGAMFVNIPIPIVRAGWNCHACGHEWNETPDSAQD